MSHIAVDYNILNQRGTPAWFSANLADIPTAGVSGRMFISIDTYAFYRDTGTGWDLIGGPGTGSVTGTGTTNYLSKFSSSSIISSSLLFDDGTNVGIGTTTPRSQFEINGITGDNFTEGIRITRNGVPGQYGIFNISGGTNNFTAVNTSTGEPFFNWLTSTNGTSTTVRMTLNKSPYMLDVTGSFRSTGGAYLGTSGSFCGIGTASPNNNLEIVSGTNPNMALTTSASNLYVYYGMNAGTVGGALFTFCESYIPGNYNAGTTALTNNSWGIVLNASSGTGILQLQTNTTPRLSISNAGAVQITNLGTGTVSTTSGVLYTSSDMNLKISDGYIETALDKILKLKPRYFFWKEESNLPTDLRQLGFYAQEVNEILGEEVSNTPKTKDDKWGINDRSIIAFLTKAIQELNEKLIKNNIN